MTLRELAAIRARGQRPRGLIWCSLGAGDWMHDLHLTGDEPAADLAPLHACSLLLDHDGWTPTEVWPTVERLLSVRVGSVVAVNRQTADAVWLVHPFHGLSVMPLPEHWRQIAEARPTWN